MSKSFLPKQEWQQRVRQWLESGKSAKAWCLENQVTYTTFLGWRERLKKLEQESSPATFIELKNNTELGAITLEYAGVKIHLLTEFDATLLRKCLNTLRGS